MSQDDDAGSVGSETPACEELLHGLPAALRESAEAIHLPAAHAILARCQSLARPCLVGFCGPQASGKSTGAAIIAKALMAWGLRVATLSIDDVYLTRAEREAMARN